LEGGHCLKSHELFVDAQLRQLGEWDELHQHYHTIAIVVDRMVPGGWQRDETPTK
jgi:hypothetical protein